MPNPFYIGFLPEMAARDPLAPPPAGGLLQPRRPMNTNMDFRAARDQQIDELHNAAPEAEVFSVGSPLRIGNPGERPQDSEKFSLETRQALRDAAMRQFQDRTAAPMTATMNGKQYIGVPGARMSHNDAQGIIDRLAHEKDLARQDAQLKDQRDFKLKEAAIPYDARAAELRLQAQLEAEKTKQEREYNDPYRKAEIGLMEAKAGSERARIGKETTDIQDSLSAAAKRRIADIDAYIEATKTRAATDPDIRSKRSVLFAEKAGLQGDTGRAMPDMAATMDDSGMDSYAKNKAAGLMEFINSNNIWLNAAEGQEAGRRANLIANEAKRVLDPQSYHVFRDRLAQMILAAKAKNNSWGSGDLEAVAAGLPE